jgi:hypothetical protein
MIGDYSSVVYPCLKVAGRSLDDKGRLKSCVRHSGDRLSAEIIDYAQWMSAVRSDKNVRAARVLAPEPAERRIDLLGAPALAEQHPPVLMKNANVE